MISSFQWILFEGTISGERSAYSSFFFKEGKKIPEGNLSHRSEKNDNAMAKKNQQTDK